MDDEIRIDFTITRRRAGEADFTDVGFGCTAAVATVDDAAHLLTSALQNKDWETTPGMPDPDELP